MQLVRFTFGKFKKTSVTQHTITIKDAAPPITSEKMEHIKPVHETRRVWKHFLLKTKTH